MKSRRCSHCKKKGPQEEMLLRQLKAFCNQECFIGWAAANVSKLAKEGRKIESKRLKAKKEKLKTKGEHLREAQTAFNAYIRLRDEKEPCISCGRYHTGQNHAGHYRSVGSAPELRFEESNVWKQCAPCNNHLSGNLTNYRINLIKKIGLKKVEWLEGPHEPKRYTIEQIQEIKSHYRKLYREMLKQNAA
ncbi:recombination protein NinG [Alteromonas sp. IB21]|uniref:recombination protein NinG n=1 Tax=Alteromonas sp. IB21 TaxID=2779369 RepID=UPI0018E8AB1F|nr:recombination protein NinG [Alteromonas sp. IB21]MBJ2129081.1 recombination protein NinG [Alteromonas sp. IB21]